MDGANETLYLFNKANPFYIVDSFHLGMLPTGLPVLLSRGVVCEECLLVWILLESD